MAGLTGSCTKAAHLCLNMLAEMARCDARLHFPMHRMRHSHTLLRAAIMAAVAVPLASRLPAGTALAPARSAAAHKAVATHSPAVERVPTAGLAASRKPAFADQWLQLVTVAFADTAQVEPADALAPEVAGTLIAEIVVNTPPGADSKAPRPRSAASAQPRSAGTKDRGTDSW